MADGEPRTITRMTPVAEMPSLLRVPEFAAVADISTGLVYEGIQRGTIKAVHFGRVVRIPRTQLEEWLGSHG